MPAPKRGQNKTRSALRTPNTSRGDSRNNTNQSRRVHFDNQSARGQSSRRGEHNAGPSPAPRGRGRGAGNNARARSQPGRRTPTAPRLGNHELVQTGDTSIPDAMTSQTANSFVQQQPAPKRDWTGISVGARFEQVSEPHANVESHLSVNLRSTHTAEATTRQ